MQVTEQEIRNVVQQVLARLDDPVTASSEDEGDCGCSTAEPEESKGGEFERWRLMGLALIGIGVVVIAAFLAWPLYQMKQQAAEVTIYDSFLWIGGFVFLAGVYLTIFGKKALSLVPDDKDSDLNVTQLVVLAINVAILVIAMMWLDSYLDGLGWKEVKE